MLSLWRCHPNEAPLAFCSRRQSDLVAAGFLAAGLEPGDRLGIWGPNSYEWYLTQFAAAKAGLILVRARRKGEKWG